MNTNPICIHCNQPGSTTEEIVIDGNGHPTHEICRKAYRESTFRQWDFLMLIRDFEKVACETPELAKAFEGSLPTRDNFSIYPACIAAALPKAEELGIARGVISKLNEIRRAMIELCAS